MGVFYVRGSGRDGAIGKPIRVKLYLRLCLTKNADIVTRLVERDRPSIDSMSSE